MIGIGMMMVWRLRENVWKNKGRCRIWKQRFEIRRVKWRVLIHWIELGHWMWRARVSWDGDVAAFAFGRGGVVNRDDERREKRGLRGRMIGLEKGRL